MQIGQRGFVMGHAGDVNPVETSPAQQASILLHGPHCNVVRAPVNPLSVLQLLQEIVCVNRVQVELGGRSQGTSDSGIDRMQLFVGDQMTDVEHECFVEPRRVAVAELDDVRALETSVLDPAVPRLALRRIDELLRKIDATIACDRLVDVMQQDTGAAAEICDLVPRPELAAPDEGLHAARRQSVVPGNVIRPIESAQPF